jgi:hypothetical protein
MCWNRGNAISAYKVSTTTGSLTPLSPATVRYQFISDIDRDP